ncbi:hypothetical protein BI364_11345 [Acidihalobacter yilgarnensis]|uniref:Flagellar assembly protein FliH n=1 Tax=Acidihalobacter yilgarnensis TaxID=2819280 RepID=A0A1D8IPP1_9GAMM|nr:flagellar assembly protein FliH [Acidihalobacter yilgarnensis]AOU98470.1 hypothetical protein BI364_11345 [Acidihalobacter yilgarnensis]
MSKLILGESSDVASLWQVPSMDLQPMVETIETGSPISEEVETLGRHPFTADQLEQVEAAAREEGFRQGHTEGLAAAEQEARIRVERLDEILYTLARPLEEMGERVGEELLALTVAIARQLVRRELATSPGEIVAVVREALQALPSYASDVRLELHPDDARLVREIMPEGEGEHAWRVVEDAALARGGCRVRSDVSRVDATVEHRLNQIAARVLGDSRSEPEAP